MLKLIQRYKQGNKSPDNDPDNPYHYHNAKGEKIVITSEDWKANVSKPYFKEIEDAVRAEQAAYPAPEYEVNPDFIRDLRSTYRSNMGNGYQNYRNFSSSLPQGYTFTSEGMIVDPQGNYYVQSGYRQSPRFTYSTDNPLRFTINKGKPIEKNLTFYPVNMDKRVKAPLPVNRTLNINQEKERAISNYIQTHNTEKQIPQFFQPYVQTSLPYSNDFYLAVPTTWMNNNWYQWTPQGMSLAPATGSGPDPGKDVIIGDWYFMNMNNSKSPITSTSSFIQSANNYSESNPITEEEFDALMDSYGEIVNRYGYIGINRMHPKLQWRTDPKIIKTQTSRKDAEQKAVIPINKSGSKLKLIPRYYQK